MQIHTEQYKYTCTNKAIEIQFCCKFIQKHFLATQYTSPSLLSNNTQSKYILDYKSTTMVARSYQHNGEVAVWHHFVWHHICPDDIENTTFSPCSKHHFLPFSLCSYCEASLQSRSLGLVLILDRHHFRLETVALSPTWISVASHFKPTMIR